VLSLLFAVCNGFVKDKSYRVYATIAITLASFLLLPLLIPYHNQIPWGIDVSVYVLPFCLWIRLLYERKDLVVKQSWSRYAWVGALLIWGLSYSLIKPRYMALFVHRLDLAQLNIPVNLYENLLLLGLSLSIFVAALPYKHGNWLTKLGVASMPIYLLHMKVLGLLVVYVPSIWVGYLPNALSIIVLLAVPYLIGKVLGWLSPQFEYVGLAWRS
jgi:fucose 4-O-acetylase-like acetyltransferase